MRREAAAGQTGRTHRGDPAPDRAQSLRAGVDRVALGERQITVDCDVIQADGGNALRVDHRWLGGAETGGQQADENRRRDFSDPLISITVAAVSCGIYAGQPVLDLDYPEDSEAGVDGNFIMTGEHKRLIEVQMSGRGRDHIPAAR